MLSSARMRAMRSSACRFEMLLEALTRFAFLLSRRSREARGFLARGRLLRLLLGLLAAGSSGGFSVRPIATASSSEMISPTAYASSRRAVRAGRGRGAASPGSAPRSRYGQAGDFTERGGAIRRRRRASPRRGRVTWFFDEDCRRALSEKVTRASSRSQIVAADAKSPTSAVSCRDRDVLITTGLPQSLSGSLCTIGLAR